MKYPTDFVPTFSQSEKSPVILNMKFMSGVPTGITNAIETRRRVMAQKPYQSCLSVSYISELGRCSQKQRKAKPSKLQWTTVPIMYRPKGSNRTKQRDNFSSSSEPSNGSQELIVSHSSTHNIENLKSSGGTMAAGLAISIKGFEKFKGRTDVRLNSWFRCSNRLLEDPDLFDFSHSEICVWIYILSLASQKNLADVNMNFEHANRIARLKEREILSAIDKLAKLNIITVHDTSTLRARSADVTATCSTGQYNTEQDNTKQELSSQLIELWNSNCKDLPKIQKVTEKRKAAIRAEISKYPDLEHWSQALAKLTASEFATTKWCPNFDDFLREDIRIKALEGKYDNRNPDKPPDLTNKIRESIKKFGSYNGSEAQAFLGDDGWQLVKKMGGWAQLCRMSEKQIQEVTKG